MSNTDLINIATDIGDLLMMVDENYNSETNEYDKTLLESVEESVDIDNVNDGDPDVDEDIYYDESEDDYLDVSDKIAAQLRDAEQNWAEREIDDEVMDMIIDDEDDEMTEDDVQRYNDEYGTEDLVESSLDHLNFNDGYPEDADCLTTNKSNTSDDAVQEFVNNLHLI